MRFLEQDLGFNLLKRAGKRAGYEQYGKTSRFPMARDDAPKLSRRGRARRQAVLRAPDHCLVLDSKGASASAGRRRLLQGAALIGAARQRRDDMVAAWSRKGDKVVRGFERCQNAPIVARLKDRY